MIVSCGESLKYFSKAGHGLFLNHSFSFSKFSFSSFILYMLHKSLMEKKTINYSKKMLERVSIMDPYL